MIRQAGAAGGGRVTLACRLEQALYVGPGLAEFLSGARYGRLGGHTVSSAWPVGSARSPSRVRSLGAKPSGCESGSLVGVHLAKAGAREHVCPRRWVRTLAPGGGSIAVAVWPRALKVADMPCWFIRGRELSPWPWAAIVRISVYTFQRFPRWCAATQGVLHHGSEMA